MATYFWDTSALSKHYHVETGTDRVESLLKESGALHLISRLTVVEVQSVFARKVKSAEITSEVFREIVLERFFQELEQGEIRVLQMSPAVYQRAGFLIRHHGSKESLGRFRTLDGLQLATALMWSEQARLDHLVSSDKTLGAVAQTEGLSVINPELGY